MANESNRSKANERNIQTLKQYIPIVARVHGTHHPEFHDVHRLFNTINEKLEQSGNHELELTEEFVQLRKITNNYSIPGDVCESYETVYKLLAKLDNDYQNAKGLAK